jgi:curli biogenesis system outer membrane secretion channel CsgG
MDELTSLLVNENKFIVVDRRSLDAIRYEQYFQRSGDVGDDTAVSIGKLLGADVIITGALRKNDNSLMLKAINVTTAQILASITI